MQKLRIALQTAIDSGKLSDDVKAKLLTLIEPTNLATAAAFIGGYAVLHATPLAPGLAVVDAYMLGSAAAETSNAIFQLYLDLDSATTQQELDQAAGNLSTLLSGPIADALLKVLLLGAAKGAKAIHVRYKFELPPGVADGSRLNMGVPLPKITRRDITSGAPPKLPVKEGIYEFPDLRSGGIPYVGQSENIPGRLRRHEAAGRLTSGSETTTPVTGGKTAREIAEHNRIQDLTGGQKAKNSPIVANKKDPIGPKRRPRLGLPEPRE